MILCQFGCFATLSLPPQSTTNVHFCKYQPPLSGEDVYAAAKTGSGKTAAFALPILHQLFLDPFGVFAVVLTPTRYLIVTQPPILRGMSSSPSTGFLPSLFPTSELAFQIAEQFRIFGKPMGLREAVVVGGVGKTLDPSPSPPSPWLPKFTTT